MTCASCAASTESIVKYQEGVVSASVNFATGNLTVEYLPNMTDVSNLQKAVQSIGYDLLIKDSFLPRFIFFQQSEPRQKQQSAIYF